MVKYDLSVNGKRYEVEVDDPHTEPVTVTVNGKAFQVSVTAQSGSPPARLATRLDEAIEDVYVPTVTSTYVETDIAIEEELAPAAAPPAASGSAATNIAAPMPGKILDIAVQIGSQVKQGDVLCNLEAMKMKSPIRSTTEGTIAQIRITEGQNVNFGDVLFTIR